MWWDATKNDIQNADIDKMYYNALYYIKMQCGAI